MPEKDPSNWIGLWSALPEAFRAALLSAVIAWLRIMYDGKESRWVRRLLEAMLCGGVTLACASAISAMGLNPDWAVFVGGAIGGLGIEPVRQLALRFAARKADGR